MPSASSTGASVLRNTPFSVSSGTTLTPPSAPRSSRACWRARKRSSSNAMSAPARPTTTYSPPSAIALAVGAVAVDEHGGAPRGPGLRARRGRGARATAAAWAWASPSRRARRRSRASRPADRSAAGCRRRRSAGAPSAARPRPGGRGAVGARVGRLQRLEVEAALLAEREAERRRGAAARTGHRAAGGHRDRRGGARRHGGGWPVLGDHRRGDDHRARARPPGGRDRERPGDQRARRRDRRRAHRWAGHHRARADPGPRRHAGRRPRRGHRAEGAAAVAAELHAGRVLAATDRSTSWATLAAAAESAQRPEPASCRSSGRTTTQAGFRGHTSNSASHP